MIWNQGTRGTFLRESKSQLASLVFLFYLTDWIGIERLFWSRNIHPFPFVVEKSQPSIIFIDFLSRCKTRPLPSKDARNKNGRLSSSEFDKIMKACSKESFNGRQLLCSFFPFIFLLFLPFHLPAFTLFDVITERNYEESTNCEQWRGKFYFDLGPKTLPITLKEVCDKDVKDISIHDDLPHSVKLHYLTSGARL